MAKKLHEWGRFDSRTTASEARRIPFDLLYLVPKNELPDLAKVYDVFIIVEPTPALKESMEKREVTEVRQQGMTRQESQVFKLRTPETLESLVKNLGEMTLCAPVLPRRSQGETRPGYVLTKGAQAKLTQRHETFTAKGAKIKGEPYEEVAASMRLMVNGKERLPCAICTQGLKKVLDDTACTLGTESCFKKISLKGVHSFHEKEKGGVVPQEYADSQAKEVVDATGVCQEPADKI